MKTREKHFSKFKKSNLQINYDLYIEAKYNVQKLVKKKKIDFYKQKLTENIGKPKELWKCLKSLGLSKNKTALTNICLKSNDNVTNFDDKKNANIFKNFYSTLAEDLLRNLPPPSLKFGLPSVRQYYENILNLPNSKFKFASVSEETFLKIL